MKKLLQKFNEWLNKGLEDDCGCELCNQLDYGKTKKYFEEKLGL